MGDRGTPKRGPIPHGWQLPPLPPDEGATRVEISGLTSVERIAEAMESIAESLKPAVEVAASNDPIDDSERGTLFEDLRSILRALDLPDGARPYSAHEVVQRDILPAIRARQRLAAAQTGEVPAYVWALLDSLATGKAVDFLGARVPVSVQAYLKDHIQGRKLP